MIAGLGPGAPSPPRVGSSGGGPMQPMSPKRSSQRPLRPQALKPELLIFHRKMQKNSTDAANEAEKVLSQTPAAIKP